MAAAWTQKTPLHVTATSTRKLRCAHQKVACSASCGWLSVVLDYLFLAKLLVSNRINRDGIHQAQEMTGHDAREELCFQQALVRCRLPYNLSHSAGK